MAEAPQNKAEKNSLMYTVCMGWPALCNKKCQSQVLWNNAYARSKPGHGTLYADVQPTAAALALSAKPPHNMPFAASATGFPLCPHTVPAPPLS